VDGVSWGVCCADMGERQEVQGNAENAPQDKLWDVSFADGKLEGSLPSMLLCFSFLSRPALALRIGDPLAGFRAQDAW